MEIILEILTRCRIRFQYFGTKYWLMLKRTETHGEGGRMIVEDLFEFYFLLVNVLDNGTYQNQRRGGGGSLIGI